MTELQKAHQACTVDLCACPVVMRVCEAAYEQGRRDGERGFPAPATVAIVRAALAGEGSNSPETVNSGGPVNGATLPSCPQTGCERTGQHYHYEDVYGPDEVVSE